MLRTLIRHSQLLVGAKPTQHLRLSGALKGSRQSARIDYHGSGDSLAFLALHLLEEHEVELLQAAAGGASSSAAGPDLVLVELPPLAAALRPPKADIRIPAWISQQIELNPPTGGAAPQFTRHLRREVERHIRRGAYTLDFTRDEAALREFFREMYQPYVRARFDAQAILVNEETFLREASTQLLARLHSDGRWVAGMLLKTRGAELRFGWFGARSSPPPQGASEVLDALVIQWAPAQGLKRIVLGHSRPCLNDGVLRYKRRFGAGIHSTTFPQPQIFVRIERPSAALAQCLDAAALLRVDQARARVHRVELRDGRAWVHLEEVTHAA